MAILTTLLAVTSLLATASAETVHGSLVFSRHGDRTSKHYSGYTLTSLGFQQNFQVGSDYRTRYLSASSPQRIFNISELAYVPSQIYSTAPDQMVLLTTAQAFLQGLYPPLNGNAPPAISTQTLNNGTETSNPLGGYQYVFLHGANTNSPDTVWIKGDDACPVLSVAEASFKNSTEFKTRVSTTRDFYSRFGPILERPAVYNYNNLTSNMTYGNAYDIFDLINVARIHNATSPARNVSDVDMLQLRTLADSAEFAANWNASQPARAIGGQTFAGAVLAQLNQTVSSAGKLKFSLLAGSYDTFLAFFALAGLTSKSTDFTGLPDYASTMAFELFTPDTTPASGAFPSKEAVAAGALRVRFLFRNGTAGALTQWPLFGGDAADVGWPDFVQGMQSFAITSAAKWCDACAATADFCAAYKDDTTVTPPATAGETTEGGSSGLSNAVAGVIGAMVTLAVVLVLGALAFVLLRRRNKAKAVAAPVAPATAPAKEKGSGSLHSGEASSAA